MPISEPTQTTPIACRGLRLSAIKSGLCLMLALVSAGLLAQAYFPQDFGWIAWFALVPGLVLVRADLRPRTRYLTVWLAALAFFIVALRWMRVAHEQMFYSWLALSLFCSLFAPVVIWLIRLLDRRDWALTWSVPVVWTAIEFVRTHLFGGFPWYLLGHSQHDFLAIIQIADLVGVPGVTFLVAAVNGLIAEWLYSRPQVAEALPISTRPTRLMPQLVAISLLLICVTSYGYWRLNQGPFQDGPVVALLQTDLEQGVRNDRIVESIDIQNQKLMAEAIAGPQKPDLIVWAETTFPGMWKVAQHPAPTKYEYTAWSSDLPDLLNAFDSLAKSAGCAILLGLNTEVFADASTADQARARFEARVAALGSASANPEEFRAGQRKAYEEFFGELLARYNSSLLIGADGKVQDRYDKTHLVPFGEYVPLVKALPFLSMFAPYAGDALNMLTPGERFTRFRFSCPKGEFTFGSLICYESAYAHLAREYITGDGSPVQFLVNQSNDGWFRCTQEHEQHLAICQFRAIECRRPLVRAVNMGISAVIDGNGRVVALPGPTWQKSKGLMAVVKAPIPLDHRTSMYARTGDWLPWLCWAGIAFGLVVGRKERVA
jgi:apolipoprotein N-acyltransferase